MKSPTPFSRHERSYADFQYVYPVISRRSEGLSIGVNLNPDKNCNYDCLYCQVDRTTMPPPAPHVELQTMELELDLIFQQIDNEKLFEEERFQNLPHEGLKTLRDIALSGDGEPTLCPEFVPSLACVMRKVQEWQDQGFPQVKAVCITNGTTLSAPVIKQALAEMIASGGEAWVKWDAGNAEDFERIYAVPLSLAKVSATIRDFACNYPITLQTMLFHYADQTLSLNLEDYCQMLNFWIQTGSQILKIQLYTLARNPKDPTLIGLNEADLLKTADLIRQRTGLTVQVYA